jgi:DNA-binding CsgD family transcriptional regulator
MVRTAQAEDNLAGNEKECMKQSVEIAHFRQQCCLGIDAQTAMPSLLRALRLLIGSQANSFYWADYNGDIDNVYMEQLFPGDMAAHFFREFLNNPADDYSALGIRKFLPPGSLVGSSARLFPKSFYRSDMYNLIWRPRRRQEMLWARVRDAQGRANGIALMRESGDPAFTEHEEQRLGQLVPYLAHAINARPSAPSRLVYDGESAIVLLDHCGRIQHESIEGRRLLLLAAHERLAPGTVDWKGDSVLPLVLAKLRESVEVLMAGRPAPPPVFELQNAWGKFVLRGYPLETGKLTGNSLIAVLIERHVPISLKLMQVMRSLPLSAKQKEVCLLLTEGASYRAVAERLSVRQSTVIDHVRKIYGKFDVRSHHELLRKLIRADPGTPTLPFCRPRGQPCAVALCSSSAK